MTALEAIAPMVKCGYLYLNQADNAPGYDPPIVMNGELSVILWVWVTFIC